MNFDYVVIGAGVSGMAAACILARQGLRVALLERAPNVAPLLRGFKRDGLRFDSGFHYSGGLGRGQILSAYFSHLGVNKHLSLEPVSEPHESGLVQDTLRILSQGRDMPHDYAVPYDYDALSATLNERFPQERAGIRAYLDAVRDVFRATPYLNLEAEEEPDFAPLQGKTLDQALREWVTDPVLRHLLGLHHFFYGVPPQGVSFLDHARFTGSYYDSTRFIHGGGQALAKAFEISLDEAGVRVMPGREVREILCSPAGILRGVRLEDGEELACGGVVATVHPRLLARLAPRAAFRPAYAENLRTLRETPSAYMLFGVADRPVSVLRRGALHVAPRVGASLFGLERQLLEQRQLFIAPAGDEENGRQPLGVVCPAYHEEMDDVVGEGGRLPAPGYAERKHEITAQLETLVLKACPELRNHWRLLDAATPLTFRRYGGSPTGSLYGVRHAMDARCPLPRTRLPGLYVAGQSVTGPGVLGATVSAYVACSLIVGREKLLAEVRQCL